MSSESNPQKPTTYTRRIPVSRSLVAPAVRTVVIQLWDDEDCTDADIYPVLAIESAIDDVYTKRHNGGMPRGPRDESKPSEWLEAGWTHKREWSLTEIIVADGCVDTQSVGLQATNARQHTVACPWPAEEDAQKLTPIVEKLKGGEL